MEIKRLEREDYVGRQFTAWYQTSGFYEILTSQQGFRVEYVPLETPAERTFEDVFFGEWLEVPAVFGAFEGGRLPGFAEESPETWNRRFRVSNLCVFEEAARCRGIGTALNAEPSGRKDYHPHPLRFAKSLPSV